MTKKELDVYLKRKDIVIENNTAKWEINQIGDIKGLYTGTFIFKCFLTPTEKLAAGRDYRDFLGENAVMALQHEDNLAFSLSQLKYRVISAPPFWTSSMGTQGGVPGDIPDVKIIDTVLDAAIASELKYLAILQKNKEDAIKKATKSGEDILNNKIVTEENEDSDDEEEYESKN